MLPGTGTFDFVKYR